MNLASWKILLPALSSVLLMGASSANDLPDPPPCNSCFIGKLLLKDNPADLSGTTKLLGEDLYFVDSDNFVWKAGKGDTTDGATIPDLLKPFVGESFEPDFLPAAVIHDHYTHRAHRVRSWRDTARVFYQAMLVNNVNIVKAKTMYFAVYAFGPHWGVLAKGVPCGKNCVFTAPVQLSASAGGRVVTSAPITLADGKVYAEEGANFSTDHSSELKQVEQKIKLSELRGTPLSLKDLEFLAALSHGENVFLVSE
ncbi:DUF1353 domain-containing protein [Bradyrhizobium sp. I71]|uniref:DUF1353 domain-containing protein n=1 Tax=Bradyrhizobium sp. I71 TaxID=2590772 RepID=UPI001EF7DF66|nr:DUF1353 domain-containing protein [Bradyrhizobium sp. I71]ULL01224.1 DUF1353 domain-containing protein [Bradyrhizobium sp. I71]